MKSFFGASLSIALAAALTTSVLAGELPEVKISASNKVPSCATPERLTEYLRQRNPRLNSRFEDIAALYKKHGETLGIRWDIAFFQMILETGALRFTGDVRADQNNFAGLGASGGGAHGERFADVSSGVKAHLQHLLMYAGEHIDDPVADRTRKVQEWGVLTEWQKSIDGPMTYTLVARQWAPTSRNYVRDVSTITDGFYSGYCTGSDPVSTQEANAGDTATAKVASTTEAAPADQSDAPPVKLSASGTGSAIAKRNIEQERGEGGALKGLGAGMLASTEKPADKPAAAQDAPPVTLLNASQDDSNTSTAKAEVAKAETAKTETPSTPASKQATTKTASKTKPKQDAKTAANDSTPADPGKGANANVQTASINSAATQLKVPQAKSGGACKVWTASYGGQRAVIIKANASGSTNYTVLDVTEANEKREVDAYIAAYAKGGEKIGSFPNQTKALTKAFELCPEG